MYGTVRIIKGTNGPRFIENKVFKLAKSGIFHNAKGAYVVVNAIGHESFPQRNVQVFIKDDQDVIFEDDTTFESTIIEKPTIDKNEVKTRLASCFSAVYDLARAAVQGQIRGLIVSGAPGVGKSYEVERALAKERKLAFTGFGNDDAKYEIVKGNMTAAGLYEKLYQFSDENSVLVIDDCDAVLFDSKALNVLKSALDTSDTRIISWVTSSDRGMSTVPDSFEFKGSLIFISNVDFEKSINSNRESSKHLEALIDRCLHVDIGVHTLEEKLIRIEQVCFDQGLFKQNDVDMEDGREIFDFIIENASRFRSLSLRRVLQIVDLYRLGGDWKAKAVITLMKKA